MRIRIKICGITSLEDALKAADLGVDAVGFNFYPASPRYVAPERVGEIITRLPPFLSTVGVFVNESLEKVREIFETLNLNYAQLHGEESPEYVSSLKKIPVIKVFRIRGGEKERVFSPYIGKVRAFLLDTYQRGRWGGTGKTFSWDTVLSWKKVGVPLIIAGGITPHNVEELVRFLRPYGIDVCSGVERSPGVKDGELMRELVKKVRMVENEISG